VTIDGQQLPIPYCEKAIAAMKKELENWKLEKPWKA
jgi:hypothetical protein